MLRDCCDAGLAGHFEWCTCDLDGRAIALALGEIAFVASQLIAVREAGFTAEALKWPRDELSFVMICAFNGCPAHLAPDGWRYFPNEGTKKMWERVGKAALDYAGH